jgi:hypothetical protein
VPGRGGGAPRFSLGREARTRKDTERNRLGFEEELLGIRRERRERVAAAEVSCACSRAIIMRWHRSRASTTATIAVSSICTVRFIRIPSVG